jgi:lipopolysaccharide export LptBFGC system permease protein LptF
MSGIARYVLRQTLGVMLFAAVSFTAAVWLFLDLILNRGLSLGLFRQLAVLIPAHFVGVALPIAVVIANLCIESHIPSRSVSTSSRAASSDRLLSLPFVFAAMVLIAATFSLHGDTALMIAIGLGMYLVLNIILALGRASIIPASPATRTGVSWALGASMRFYLKDG